MFFDIETSELLQQQVMVVQYRIRKQSLGCRCAPCS
jgi:hypothetical protein